MSIEPPLLHVLVVVHVSALRSCLTKIRHAREVQCVLKIEHINSMHVPFLFMTMSKFLYAHENVLMRTQTCTCVHAHILHPHADICMHTLACVNTRIYATIYT